MFHRNHVENYGTNYQLKLLKDLLHELDEIPYQIVKDATREVKIHHDFIMKQSASCVLQQNRFEKMKKNLKFHFTTKKKPKRRRSPSPFRKK